MIHRIVTGVMMVGVALAAHAQQTDTTPPQNVQLQHQEIARGEPARWTEGDQSTAERTRILRKEIGAALAEARQGCKQVPANERSACLKEAQQTYQDDMAKVPQLVAQK